MTYLTIGVGGDYADWYTAMVYLNGLGNLVDDYTLTQISDVTISGTLPSIALQNNSITITSNSDPQGNPNGGWITYLPQNYSMIFNNSSNYPGGSSMGPKPGSIIVEYINLHVVGTGTGGYRLHTIMGSATVRDCIICGNNYYTSPPSTPADVGYSFENFSSSSYIIYNNKFYNCAYGIYWAQGGTITGSPFDPPGTKVIENCSIYGGTVGIIHAYNSLFGALLEYWDYKNIVCSGQSGFGSAAFIMTDLQPVNTMTNCAAHDSSLPSFCTNPITGIIDSDFLSVNIADSNFLDIDTDSALFGTGTTNISAFNTEDIDGDPRPNGRGSVSIGADEPLILSTINQMFRKEGLLCFASENSIQDGLFAHRLSNQNIKSSDLIELVDDTASLSL